MKRTGRPRNQHPTRNIRVSASDKEIEAILQALTPRERVETLLKAIKRLTPAQRKARLLNADAHEK